MLYYRTSYTVSRLLVKPMLQNIFYSLLDSGIDISIFIFQFNLSKGIFDKRQEKPQMTFQWPASYFVFLSFALVFQNSILFHWNIVHVTFISSMFRKIEHVEIEINSSKCMRSQKVQMKLSLPAWLPITCAKWNPIFWNFSECIQPC